MSGYNVDPISASVEYRMTAALAREMKGDYAKTGGADILAFHMIQSFSPYARLHEGELAAFDHAAAQLEKLGVNTNVDPEKVLTLVKEQDGKVSELSAALKETTAKIDALRQAQRIVKEIYQQPKEPQEKRKERENQEL